MKLAQIWRYPIKSMLGERLERARVGPMGIEGDRQRAVVDAGSGVSLSAKRHAELLLCRAWTGHGQVMVGFPDGFECHADSAQAANRLSALLHRRVVVRPAQAGRAARHEFPTDLSAGAGETFVHEPGFEAFFDSAPFHLITTATLDEFARRKILVISQILSTILAIIPGILTGLEVIRVWHLYTLGLLNATITGFDGPARQALVPTLVPRGELMRAVALTSAVRRSTALVGPMIGGLGISLVGVTWAYFIYALFHGLVLIALALMKTRPMEAPIEDRTSMTQSIVEGFRSVLDNRVIWGILSIEAFHTFFVTYRVLLPVFARDILNVGPAGLGLLYSAPGIGALTGSALAIAMGDVEKKGRLFTISAFTMPLALILFAFSAWMPASLGFLALAGLLDIVGGTVRNTMLQLSINERMRGRVMSMNMMVHRGIGPLSHLQSGALASLVGAPWAITGACTFFLVYGASLLLRLPELYRYPEGRMRS